MVGQTGLVKTPLDPEGHVQVDGELWQAVAADGPVAAGEQVRITGVDGLTLTVARAPRRA
jgi:membrane-bound serine protease (ClpP class)